MGQLMHQFHSLSDVARHGGRVHRGRVVEARNEGRDVLFRIEQTWPATPDPPRRWWHRWWPPPPAPPPVREFALQRDVEWTDPHRSPVDFGVAGGLRRLAPDQEALIVEGIPIEALALTPRNLETVALVFDAAARTAYAARPAAEIAPDLNDPNRTDLALEALRSTGRFTADVLWPAFDGAGLRSLIDRVIERLPPEERRRLAAESVGWVTRTPAAQRGDRLAVAIAARVAYLSYLDPADRELARPILCAVDPHWALEREQLYGLQAALERIATEGPPRSLAGWGPAVAAVLGAGKADERVRRLLLDALDPAEAAAIDAPPPRSRRRSR